MLGEHPEEGDYANKPASKISETVMDLKLQNGGPTGPLLLKMGALGTSWQLSSLSYK